MHRKDLVARGWSDRYLSVVGPGSAELPESGVVAVVEGWRVSPDQAPDASPERVSDCAAFLRR